LCNLCLHKIISNNIASHGPLIWVDWQLQLRILLPFSVEAFAHHSSHQPHSAKEQKNEICGVNGSSRNNLWHLLIIYVCSTHSEVSLRKNSRKERQRLNNKITQWFLDEIFSSTEEWRARKLFTDIKIRSKNDTAP
jgi:hypothetical protein